MNSQSLNVLLADDDKDDCLFFAMALETLIFPTRLATVVDGEKLMDYLVNNTDQLPDVLFLDLNMPRKNGFECLSEIKNINRLKHLPVIIFSTSFEQEVVNRLYINGARYFMRKPPEFSQLKRIIHQTVTLIMEKSSSLPGRETFVLTVENNSLV